MTTTPAVPVLTAEMAEKYRQLAHEIIQNPNTSDLQAIATGQVACYPVATHCAIKKAELEAKDRRIAELEAALRGLMKAKHVSLGDLVYDIREREGQGWDGPAVVAWSNAVHRAETAIASASGEGK